jgi:hypothetical protein
MKLTVTRRSARIVDVRFEGDVRNPLVPPEFTPGITWDFFVTIDVTNPTIPRYRVQGDHDGFPAYELYVEHRRVHHFAPESADEIDKLFGEMDKHFDNTGDVFA